MSLLTQGTKEHGSISEKILIWRIAYIFDTSVILTKSAVVELGLEKIKITFENRSIIKRVYTLYNVK